MRRTTLAPIAAVLSLFLSSSALLADEETVILQNGDRITGEVLKLEGGVFEVKTAYGDLRIPKARVAKIEFAVDPLARLLSEDSAVQDLVKALRGRPSDGGADEDLVKTAMDLLESYRKLGEGTGEEDRLEELRRRLESILPRFRQSPPKEEKPKDPADSK